MAEIGPGKKQAGRGGAIAARPALPVAAQKIRAAIAAQKVAARGRSVPPSGMNKLEKRYAQHLDLLRLAGEVADWRFEALTLKIAVDVRYTPDFAVILRDGTLECHETKGFLRDDARVKLRVAARTFPWLTFRLVRWGKAGAWEIKEVPV